MAYQDTDPVFGGSHHEPQTGTASPDPIVGQGGISGTPEDTGPTGLLSRSWVSLADIGKQPSQSPSQTPVTDLARNAAAATVRGSAGALDLITNPSELVMAPARTAFATGYDWLAPKLGYSRMTPEQRADITGYGAPPEERGDISQLVSGIGKATDTDPYAVVPRTPVEANLATTIEGAIPGLALGALGPLGVMRGGLLGGLGAEAGGYAASQVPDWLKPGAEMLTNMAVQGTGGLLTPRTGAGLDPATVRIAQQGQTEGIPFRAPDITPGSPFRTLASVTAQNDALQGNMIRDMGVSPGPGELPNRITPDLIDQAKGNASTDMRSVTNTNDIGPMQSYKLLQQLQTAERQIDTAVDATPDQKTQMRARLAEIRGAVDRNTGVMKGTDYQDLTNTNSPLDSWAGSATPGVANIGRTVMRNLDGAFRDALPQDAKDAYTNAKYRYRLASTLDPLADKHQGQSLPPNSVADAFYDAQQKYGSMPGSQLDRFMSQAQLIGGGAPPRDPSLGAALSDPAAATGVVLGGPKALAARALQTLAENSIGLYARNPYRTQDVFARAMDPATRLRQALAGLAAAGGT